MASCFRLLNNAKFNAPPNYFGGFEWAGIILAINALPQNNPSFAITLISVATQHPIYVMYPASSVV